MTFAHRSVTINTGGRFRALIDGRLRAAMKAPLRGVWAARAVFVRAEIMPASSSGRLLRTLMGWFSLELRRPDPRSGCELPHTMLSRSSRPDAASSVSFRDNRPFCDGHHIRCVPTRIV
jgi:hypothetical protein